MKRDEAQEQKDWIWVILPPAVDVASSPHPNSPNAPIIKFRLGCLSWKVSSLPEAIP